jgi:solute carrier family 35 protein E1
MAGNLLLPAILLWTANYANSIALQAAGITLTYIVKALVPVFTVTYLRLCGQRQPTLVYVSLLPVCFGVALASASDLVSIHHIGR